MRLEQIVEGIRQMVANGPRPAKERIRALWAAAKRARKLGAADRTLRAFMQLATDTNLIDKRGRWTGTDGPPIRRRGRNARDPLGAPRLEPIRARTAQMIE